MKSTLRLIACSAILAIAAPSLVTAADKPAAPAEKAAAKEPAKAKEKLTPLYAEVDSITDALLTVKGTGSDLTFVINADTKITKDKAHKEPATTADVKVGQWVGGSYSKAADGSNVLHSLHLGVNQKGEPAAKSSATPAPKGDQPAKPKQ